MSDTVRFVDFFGEQFAVPQRINMRLWIKFGRVAAEGGDTADTQAAILLDKMVEACVRSEDRPRFEDTCDRESPNDEELMGFLADVMAAHAERPTGRPSDSSDGLTSTGPRSASEPGSSDELEAVREMRRLEAEGRPDKAEFIAQRLRAIRSAG